MNERDCATAVKFGEEFLLSGLAEVGAVGVGQQDDAVRAEIVECSACFGQGLL